jgi:hypothetical protein
MIIGQLQPTNANLACRQLYSRNGFVQAPENPLLWSRSLANPLVFPPHIFLTSPNEPDMSAADLSQEGQARQQSPGISLPQIDQAAFHHEQLQVH